MVTLQAPGYIYLGIEIVRETVDELRLYRVLLRKQRQVVGEFVVLGDDGATAECVVLRPAGTTKDLHDV